MNTNSSFGPRSTPSFSAPSLLSPSLLSPSLLSSPSLRLHAATPDVATSDAATTRAEAMARLDLVRLPSRDLEGGALHLKFSLPAPQSRALALLDANDWKAESSADLLCVQVPETDAAGARGSFDFGSSVEGVEIAPSGCKNQSPLALAVLFSHALSHEERASVRVLWVPTGRALAGADLWDVESLQSWIARQQNSWLLEMMRAHRLQSVYQPIVSCKNPGEVFAYECLLRGREGVRQVSPGRILDAARGAGLLFQLDFAARRTAITGAARHRIHANGAKIFINFTPMDTESAMTCLKSTLDFVDELHLPRESIVFEVIESEYIPDAALFGTVLDLYRAEGFGVALDDLGAGYASLNLLARLRPDYIKLDMELTRNVHRDPYKALIARKLLETARELDVRVVAEGIECREEAEWLCGHDCDYAQGFYFAAPSSPPPLPAH